MITLIYAAILALISVLLANQVLYVRLRGDKEKDWRENAVLRVQANFVENVPIALILLFLLADDVDSLLSWDLWCHTELIYWDLLNFCTGPLDAR